MQVDLSIACDVTFFCLILFAFLFCLFVFILKLHFRISRLFWQSFVLGHFNILFFLSSSLHFFFFLFSDVPDCTSPHPLELLIHLLTCYVLSRPHYFSRFFLILTIFLFICPMFFFFFVQILLPVWSPCRSLPLQ